MGYDTPDFIKNPKVEEDLPPHGYDFWKPGMEVKNPEAEVVEAVESQAPTPVEVEPDTEDAPMEDEAPREYFKCNLCDYTCPTERGIKMHITKVHGEQ